MTRLLHNTHVCTAPIMQNTTEPHYTHDSSLTQQTFMHGTYRAKHNRTSLYT